MSWSNKHPWKPVGGAVRSAVGSAVGGAAGIGRRGTGGLLLTGMVLFAPFPAGAGRAWAQSFPSRPITIVVPFAPGGGNDVFARQLAKDLADPLKVPVLVENRAGAGGTIGTAYVARAPADGYTLLLGHTGTLAINPVLYPKLSYDAHKDFVAVSALASAPLVLVTAAGNPITSLADLLAKARANPGKFSFASSGSGSGGHLAVKLLERTAKISLLHVPYRGTAPAITDLLGGQIDYMFSVIPSALPQIRGGKLKALAISGVRRSVMLPPVPTIAESGVPGYESSLAYGLVAPRGTPEPVLKILAGAVTKALAEPAMRAALQAEGADLMSTTTPAAFSALMQSESLKWGKLIRESDIKPE